MKLEARGWNPAIDLDQKESCPTDNWKQSCWSRGGGGGGWLAIFIYVGVCMKGQIQTLKYEFTVILHPKMLLSCISSTQKYKWQFYFSHKFDS